MQHVLASLAWAGLLFCAGCGSSPDAGATGPDGLPRAETFRVAVADFLPFADAMRGEWEAVSKSAGSPRHLDVAVWDYRALHEELFDRAGLAEGRFDAVLLHSDWIAEADQGDLLTDLTARIRKDPPDDYADGWAEDLAAAGRLGDRVVGLPYHDGLLCVVYRNGMLENEMLRRVHRAKFGYAMEPPKTWGDLQRLAGFLNRPELEMYGTALPARPGGPGPFWVLTAEVWSRGESLLDDQGLHLDTPEVRESLAAYGRLVGDRYAVHRAVREMDLFDVGRTFAEGGLVMAVAPVGFASKARFDNQSEGGRSAAAACLPGASEQPPVTLASCWVLAVPKSAPDQDLAYRFVQHCASKQADKARTLAGVLGTRKSTWEDAEVRTAVPLVSALESLHAAARALPQDPALASKAAKVDRQVMEAIREGGAQAPGTKGGAPN